MERHAAIDHLRRTIDEAIGCAGQAGLPFVVLLLDMARLEVEDVTENQDHSNVVPISKAVRRWL